MIPLHGHDDARHGHGRSHIPLHDCDDAHGVHGAHGIYDVQGAHGALDVQGVLDVLDRSRILFHVYVHDDALRNSYDVSVILIHMFIYSKP